MIRERKDSGMTLFRRTIMLGVIISISLVAPGLYAQKRSGNSSKGKPRQEQQASKNKTKSQGKGTSKKAAANQKSATTKKGKSKGKQVTESRGELERRQKATQEEITATKKKIQENEKEVSRNVKELGRLQSEIAVIKGEVEASSKRVAILGEEIKNLESNISQNEKELERLRAEYLKSVKKMRARRKGNSDLAYLFSAGSLGEAQRRIRYLREFSEWRKSRSAEIEKGVKELEARRAELARDKEMQDKALATQMSSQRQLESRHKEKNQLVAELKKNGTALQSHLAKKQSEVNTLRSRVAALIAAEQRAEEARRAAAEKKAAEQRERDLAAANSKSEQENSKSETGQEKSSQRKSGKETTSKGRSDKSKEGNGDYAKARQRRPRTQGNASTTGNGSNQAHSSTGSAASGGKGFASMQGRLPRPVTGTFTITSPFGRHALPDLPDVMYDNPGIDARVSPGATAQAVYSGKVSGVYVIPGFSTVVIVNHGDYYTVYGNLASAGVKVGDVVRQGHALGSVAADEDNPSHGMIHFEVWRNREKLNPQAWIQ